MHRKHLDYLEWESYKNHSIIKSFDNRDVVNENCKFINLKHVCKISLIMKNCTYFQNMRNNFTLNP